MINSRELRIGNLIELPSFNGTGENILADLNYHIFICDVNCIRDSEHYGKDWAGRPIPLTEEWLVKLGFELESTSKWKSGYSDIARTDKVYTTNMFGFDSSETIEIDVIYNIEETELRRIGVRKSVGSKTIDIKYVHTLQNLYFALTGEELQYGEK